MILNDLELVSAELTTACDQKILFTSTYWPDPDTTSTGWLEKLNIFLDNARDSYDFMIISGVLNLRKILWDSLDLTTGGKEALFIQCLNDHYLSQVNLFPTRGDLVTRYWTLS